MRVLYGVQGTGNGHLSRSRLVVGELARQGVEVDVLMSGRPADQVPAMPGARRVLHREGFSLAVRNGQLDRTRTLLNASPRRMWRAVRDLPLDGYDHIVTDYEPVTAWAGRMASRTVFGVGHQYAFGPQTPTVKGDGAARLLLRHFAPASLSLGLHWQPYGDAVLPPIVDTVRLARRRCHGDVVVYLPREHQDAIAALLGAVPGWRFRVYGPVSAARKSDNLTWLPVSHDPFVQDLCGAVAVICNAGFELISEAIHLGLPVLTKPLSGQFEQQSNALALQSAGLASVLHSLSTEAVQAWLSDLPEGAGCRYPDVAGTVATWIRDGAADRPEQLAAALWSETARLNSAAEGVGQSVLSAT